MNATKGTPAVQVMGIINVTPDSFSGDGLLKHSDYVAQAVAQAEKMIEDGAHMLDIGGESSRPGALPVSAEEEIRRIVPIIAAIKKRLNVTIAIDTVKPAVAEAALRVGATIINDISALTHDARMAEIVSHHKAHVILMHNRSMPDAMTNDDKIGGQFKGAHYVNVVEDVAHDLAERANAAISYGIRQDKIILDPGIGFGKSVSENLALTKHGGQLKKLGFPLLMGVSRKSFIGSILDASVQERLEGTAACVTASVLAGADIIRVHDVKFMSRVIQMATALRHA